MKKKKIFIYGNLTCIRRKLDAWKLHEYFIKNNYEIVSNPKEADIILLSTCAYSTVHAQSSLNMVKKLLKYDAELIVAGCLPEIEKEKLRRIFNGKIVSTKEIERIDDIFPENMIKFTNIKDSNILWENSDEYVPISSLKKASRRSQFACKIFHSLEDYVIKNLIMDQSSLHHQDIVNYPKIKFIKQRFEPNITYFKDTYFIRPAWGCLGNCSYCVINKAIGPLKSKPLDFIMSEFEEGINLGYKNVIFDADDLGAYGMDIGNNFAEMLDNITSISGDYKIHIRYVHPRWIVRYADYFGKVLKKGKIQSVGCSIQSGCPRILRLMHRFSNVEKIKIALNKLKESYPELLIATECINGFPTETSEEFKETLNLIKNINFSWGYIFPFSSRSGTDAEKLNPKVPNREILIRMKYAKKYLIKAGYDISFLKHFNILFFSKFSKDVVYDEGVKAFCFSTIE